MRTNKTLFVKRGNSIVGSFGRKQGTLEENLMKLLSQMVQEKEGKVIGDWMRE
jgi:hypothetical protein